MEFLILGALTALGKYLILWKLLGLGRMVWAEKFIDVIFAVLLPILFLGTFSGALLAVFSGLYLTIYLRLTALFVKPQPPKWWPKRSQPPFTCPSRPKR